MEGCLVNKKGRVVFKNCNQNLQQVGGNDEYMVSEVFFTFEIDGKLIGEFYANLKQEVGSDFETGSIEVTLPIGYQGPFNHAAFSEGAVMYFRSMIGSQGSGIHIEGNCGNIMMQNNTFARDFVIEFDIADPGTGW